MRQIAETFALCSYFEHCSYGNIWELLKCSYTSVLCMDLFGFVSPVCSGVHYDLRAVFLEDPKALWQRSAQYLSMILREEATKGGKTLWDTISALGSLYNFSGERACNF